jgi:hypothetical protein
MAESGKPMVIVNTGAVTEVISKSGWEVILCINDNVAKLDDKLARMGRDLQLPNAGTTYDSQINEIF